MKINTTPGETYIVLSTSGCTVTTGAGKQIKKLAAGQDFFTAMTGDSIISDDNASVAVAKGEILSMLNTDGTGEDVQATLRFQPVTSQSALPATGENGVIYLFPVGAPAPNQYTEWVWTGTAYEQLGDGRIDISGYAKLDAENTFEEHVTFNGLVSVMATLHADRLEAVVLDAETIGTQGLTVMGTLSLGCDSNGLPQGWLSPDAGRLKRLTVMSALEIPEYGSLRLGGNHRYFIDVDSSGNAKAKLTALSVTGLSVIGTLSLPGTSCMGNLTMGDTGGFINFSDSVITAKEISVVNALYMPGGAQILFTGYGLGNTYEAECDYIGSVAYRGEGRLYRLSVMRSLNLPADISFDGDGWKKLTSQIAAAAVATIEENDKESFTKLIFPPTGTATEEQDPSWITKKNILMETNGGQLNMTQLTATLAYAAQNRFDIAKRTLWLSTSPGTGDAVQWPANAVFPDDQPQDKIQQLNSDSTYWFDITYVGGQDSILIRKVCSWSSTTGENGPTD